MTYNGPIQNYVVHHSASPIDTTFEEIKSWHIDGNGWDDIGYHYVVTQEGNIHKGRDLAYAPAAQKPYNTGSVAICLTGDNTSEANKWNRIQVRSLFQHYLSVIVLYPDIRTYGHRDLVNTTECPGLNVRAMLLGPNFGDCI